MKKTALLAFLGIITLSVLGAIIKASLPTALPQKQENRIRIGFSLGDLREERWQKDRDLFVEAAKKEGAFVQVTSAKSNALTQNAQIENLISQGVDVLVIAPYDSEKVSEIIPLAHKANIKVISYDRLIRNADVDFYVTFDNVKVGMMEAQGITKVKNKGNFAYIGGAPTDNNASLLRKGSMEILDPLIKKGDIKLVIDQFMTDWKPEEAYKTIKTYLAEGGKIDAIIAANDGTALGAIRALKEFGLDGKIPVSGQDAELSACQRIVEGTQTLTIYKPLSLLANKAAEIAVSLAKGEKPISNNSTFNGKLDVPSFFLDSTLVTKTNMESTVIKDNFHSKNEIYRQ